MINLPSSLIVLNGFVLLLIGFLCGIPLGRAITRNFGDERVRAWRIAHGALVIGGVMLLAIGAVFYYVKLSYSAQLTLSILLIVAVYAFAYALIFGAWKGYRGLEKEAGFAANSVYYANVGGALLSFVVIVMLMYGAWRSFIVHIVA
jgi:hypothetical protein